MRVFALQTVAWWLPHLGYGKGAWASRRERRKRSTAAAAAEGSGLGGSAGEAGGGGACELAAADPDGPRSGAAAAGTSTVDASGARDASRGDASGPPLLERVPASVLNASMAASRTRIVAPGDSARSGVWAEKYSNGLVMGRVRHWKGIRDQG